MQCSTHTMRHHCEHNVLSVKELPPSACLQLEGSQADTGKGLRSLANAAARVAHRTSEKELGGQSHKTALPISDRSAMSAMDFAFCPALTRISGAVKWKTKFCCNVQPHRQVPLWPHWLCQSCQPSSQEPLQCEPQSSPLSRAWLEEACNALEVWWHRLHLWSVPSQCVSMGDSEMKPHCQCHIQRIVPGKESSPFAPPRSPSASR